MSLEIANAQLAAVLEAIEGMGIQGVPAGHLYARVMEYMTLDTFDTYIDILVEAGRITNHGHLLVAVRR